MMRLANTKVLGRQRTKKLYFHSFLTWSVEVQIPAPSPSLSKHFGHGQLFIHQFIADKINVKLNLANNRKMCIPPNFWGISLCFAVIKSRRRWTIRYYLSHSLAHAGWDDSWQSCQSYSCKQASSRLANPLMLQFLFVIRNYCYCTALLATIRYGK